MNELTKFPVNVVNSLCEILLDGIAKLQLIQAFPVDENDHSSSDLGVCHLLIDKKTFLPCKNLQGALNKEKFEKDCQDLIQLLRDMVEELKTSQTYEYLLQNVDESSAEALELHFTMKNFRKLKKTASKLEGILTSQKEYNTQKEADIDNELLNQTVLYHTEQLEAETEIKYNESLVQAQLRQNEIMLKNEEDRLSNDLLKIATVTYETQDVYFKTCKFYNEKLSQLKKEIAHMNAEYDIQLEKVEMELQIASNEKRQLQAHIKLEHELFAQRESEMEAYQYQKRKKAEEAKLLELQDIKIVTIQAWWRGVLVRQHLGPFKAFKKRAKEIRKEFEKLQAKKKEKLEEKKRK